MPIHVCHPLLVQHPNEQQMSRQQRGKRKPQGVSDADRDARLLQLLVTQFQLDDLDSSVQAQVVELWKRGTLEAQECHRLSTQHRANPACPPFARVLYSSSVLPCLLETACLRNGLDVSKMVRWTFRVFESASTRHDYFDLRTRHFEQLYSVLLAASMGGFRRRLRAFRRDQEAYAPKPIVLSWQHFGDAPGDFVALDYTHLHSSVWQTPCNRPEDASYLGNFLAQPQPPDAVPLLAQWVTFEATSCLVALLRAEWIRWLPERRQCGNAGCRFPVNSCVGFQISFRVCAASMVTTGVRAAVRTTIVRKLVNDWRFRLMRPSAAVATKPRC